ncbi:MAG: fluoride efflux transporter CrcB [Spirochaetaceae bacterium]|jgi:CrcB protein|nr:fluoride efflux transporter CrcB [Spirochaetaceae bacterium]
MKYILIGGGIGAVLRYLSIQGIQALYGRPFPAGTLAVNSAGALLIGFFVTRFESSGVSSGMRFFVVTGFLGGYTTFSTYSLETARFFMAGNIKQGLLNILLNNGMCLGFTMLGMWIAKRWPPF